MKTVQRKSPFIQGSESCDRAEHNSPDSLCSRTRFTRLQKSRESMTMKSRVTSTERRSHKINEQGSDGEEVSHDEQQHQTDIESKNMAAKQQEEQQTAHQIQDSFGSTEVPALKATESRNDVQKVSEGTPSQKHPEKERARSYKQHEARNQKCRGRRTNSPGSLR